MPAKTSWTTKEASAKKWTLEEATHLPILSIMRMKTPERAELAYFLQNQLRLRANSFKRSNVVPYAYRKLLDDFSDMGREMNFDFNAPIIKTRGRKRGLSQEYASIDNPQNRLATYITLVSDFFNAQTSTVSGWKRFGLEQDIRLFGVEVTNRPRSYNFIVKPKHTMTDDERTAFWRLYNEIRKSGRTAVYDSESMVASGFTKIWQDHEWDYSDLQGMVAKMEEMLGAQHLPEYEEHVSGDSTDPTQRTAATDIDGGRIWEW